MTGLDPRSAAPIVHEEDVADSSFEESARSALLNWNDTKGVLSGLAAVSWTRQRLSETGKIPARLTEFCAALLAHAKSQYANTTLACDGTGTAVPENGYGISTPGLVKPARLKNRINPAYPQEAKNRRLQGTVKFQAFIDQQGNVQGLDFLSGPLLLYRSSRDAVQQWRYDPTTINGHPVEVKTTIFVNYTLQ